MKKATKSPKQISNLSLLYIENNASLQSELSIHFQKIFQNVYQAFNALEGLDIFQSNKIDIVVTDLSLINKNSFEMIVEIQEINPTIPIIVLSHKNSDFRLLETLDIGLIALLEKPLYLPDLNKALQKVISLHQPKLKPKAALIKPVKPRPIKPKSNIIQPAKQEPIKPKPTIVQPIKPEPIKLKPTIVQPTKPEPIKPKPNIIQQAKQEPIKPKLNSSFNILESAKSKKTIIHCINYYKGLSITGSSELLDITNNSFSMKLNKSQFTAVLYEKQIMIKIDQHTIQAKLIHIDKHSNIVTLTNPQLVNYIQRDNNNKRIAVDKSFKASIGFENTQKELIPIDISSNYITLETDEILDLKVNDSVELTIGFEINGPSSLVSEKKFSKAFATGIIQRIHSNNQKQTIIIKHQIQKSGQNIYKKYLQEREISIITEFKMKMKTQ
ncbi:response regulator [Arcobacteraceae bacterium]|nr:response regulator [Arcobacteraceae bacterium]